MKRVITCTDCGGLSVATGTPDDYQVCCLHCDPRGPLIKRVIGQPHDEEVGEWWGQTE